MVNVSFEGQSVFLFLKPDVSGFFVTEYEHLSLTKPFLVMLTMDH